MIHLSTGINPVYELCMDHSTVMAQVLHSRHDINDGEMLELHRFLLVGLVQLMNFGELAIYLMIWRSASGQDRSLLRSGMLSPDKIVIRCRKNAITFTGQVITFVSKLVFMAAFIFTIRIGGSTLVERSTIPLLVTVQSSLSSLVMFITSPELRRYYFSWRAFWSAWT